MDNPDNKIYVGDIGTNIVVDVEEDITGATGCKLMVRKPDGTVVEWDAEMYTYDGLTRYLRYVTVDGDLDQKGKYRVQAYLTISGWTGRGETDDFKVYDPFR